MYEKEIATAFENNGVTGSDFYESITESKMYTMKEKIIVFWEGLDHEDDAPEACCVFHSLCEKYEAMQDALDEMA